jgi:hypothetical protein
MVSTDVTYEVTYIEARERLAELWDRVLADREPTRRGWGGLRRIGGLSQRTGRLNTQPACRRRTAGSARRCPG